MNRSAYLVSALALFTTFSSLKAVTVDFDTFPGGAAVPNGTVITTQYAPLGVVFSSVAGGPVAGIFAAEASSTPNFLVGNPDSFQPFTMDFTTVTPSVGVKLISVGNGIVTATAFASDLATVLDSVSVTHGPGAGVGLGNVDSISLSGPGIARVRFDITQTTTNPRDGFGIDDVVFPVPEPSTLALATIVMAATLFTRPAMRAA
jgi:hypothetical protein